MSKKMAVLITDDFEDSEFTSPADAFKLAGHQVVTVEKQAGKTAKGKQGEMGVAIDRVIDDVTPGELDALLLPGGYSPDQLRGGERFVTFARNFVNDEKPMFAIYHGPQLLISAGVVREHRLTAVKPIVVDVKNAENGFYDQEVVVDNEQLVTNRAPDDLPAFNHEVLRLLGASITPPVQLFPETQRVIGKLGSVRTNPPYRCRQHAGYWRILDVTLAHPRLFVTARTTDLAFELHTADQGHGFWLAINRIDHFHPFTGHLTVAGVLIAEQVEDHGIRVIDVESTRTPQLVAAGGAPDDSMLLTQPATNDSKGFYLSSPLCYGAHTLPQ